MGHMGAAAANGQEGTFAELRAEGACSKLREQPWPRLGCMRTEKGLQSTEGRGGRALGLTEPGARSLPSSTLHPSLVSAHVDPSSRHGAGAGSRGEGVLVGAVVGPR